MSSKRERTKRRREGLLHLREKLAAVPESWAEFGLGEVELETKTTSEEHALYAQALEQMKGIAARLEFGPDPASLLRENQLDRFYFAHAAGELAAQLNALRAGALPATLPGTRTLEQLAEGFPQEPTPLLFARGLSTYQLAASLLELVEIRLKAAASETGAGGSEPRLAPQLAAHYMVLASERYIQPGLKALEKLMGQHLGPQARNWGLGPWEVLAASVEETLETARRLKAAWGALSTAELGTKLGIEFSAAASQGIERLEATARDLAKARDRMSRRTMRGLSSSARVLLRLERWSRQAEHWREELLSAAQSLALIGAADTDPAASDLAVWLKAELEGELGQGLAEVVAMPAKLRARAEPTPGLPVELLS